MEKSLLYLTSIASLGEWAVLLNVSCFWKDHNPTFPPKHLAFTTVLCLEATSVSLFMTLNTSYLSLHGSPWLLSHPEPDPRATQSVPVEISHFQSFLQPLKSSLLLLGTPGVSAANLQKIHLFFPCPLFFLDLPINWNFREKTSNSGNPLKWRTLSFSCILWFWPGDEEVSFLFLVSTSRQLISHFPLTPSLNLII